jgi:hypothetical protein
VGKTCWGVLFIASRKLYGQFKIHTKSHFSSKIYFVDFSVLGLREEKESNW